MLYNIIWFYFFIGQDGPCPLPPWLRLGKKNNNEHLPPLYAIWRQCETSLTHCAVAIICSYVFF